MLVSELLKFGKHQTWWTIIGGCHWRPTKLVFVMRFFKFGSGLFSTLISQLRPPISTNIVPAWISHNLFGNNIKSFYLPSLFVLRVAHHFINRNIVQVVRELSYSLRDLFY
jgi:hypothetical protein